jgi:hypothetical protein
VFCAKCGFRFFDRGLSSGEAANYYSGYRSENYFQERNSFEPFYTEKVHLGTYQWLHSRNRRVALAKTLELAGAPQSFSAALDFGGARGQMLLDISAGKKAVFDLDGGETEAGITRISSRNSLGTNWELVLCCQVLEHVTDPMALIHELTQALSENGWLYVEVPDEIWSNLACSGIVRNAWLAWVAKRPLLLCAADCVSTAFRIKLGILPPMGFIPMREHLNYFTVAALIELLARCGLSIAWSGKDNQGSICAVARPQSSG